MVRYVVLNPVVTMLNLANIIYVTQGASIVEINELLKGKKHEYFEGDIDTSQMSSFRNGIGDRSMLWSNGVVPYKFDDVVPYGSSDKKDILDALSDLEKRVNTKGRCIQFKPWSGENNHIVIFQGQGCSSPVGMTGGAEWVSLNTMCTLPDKIQHEILHALGFWHEQSRPDRDNFITINWQNIQPGHEHNFLVQKNTNTLNVQYDYHSVMHYDMLTWSKNDKETITPKDKSITWTGAFEISALDVEKVRLLYNC